MLSEYSEVLTDTVDRVRAALDVAPTARVKNTGTILEKLRRFGGSWLKSIDDLAGMRIVGDFDRNGQDDLVAEILALFADEKRPPKVVDRRAEPAQGYRAVHVIVFPRGIPVEIQARTQLQHEWAELFEKMADLFGRGIRYGETPVNPLGNDLAAAVIERALVLARWLSAYEQIEATGLAEGAYVSRERADLQHELEHMRHSLQRYEAFFE
jgi:ppGpp synthetase/RelA/SpoT-type nucleotidyltranferase